MIDIIKSFGFKQIINIDLCTFIIELYPNEYLYLEYIHFTRQNINIFREIDGRRVNYFQGRVESEKGLSTILSNLFKYQNSIFYKMTFHNPYSDMKVLEFPTTNIGVLDISNVESMEYLFCG